MPDSSTLDISYPFYWLVPNMEKRILRLWSGISGLVSKRFPFPREPASAGWRECAKARWRASVLDLLFFLAKSGYL